MLWAFLYPAGECGAKITEVNLSKLVCPQCQGYLLRACMQVWHFSSYNAYKIISDKEGGRGNDYFWCLL